MTAEARLSGPREAFAGFQREVLVNSVGLSADNCADDVVVEWPFARPGAPTRIVGREAFQAFAEPMRQALPVRFEEFRNVVIHETTDPEVLIAEYDLVGTFTTTGRRSAAPFLMMLRVRDGKLVHVREYQDTIRMSEVMDG